jgi:hypothetical protein
MLNRRGKKEEEEKEMLLAAGQNTKHNRLKSDVLPEKCYNLGEYEHEKLLSGTRYVFSVKVFPGRVSAVKKCFLQIFSKLVPK